LIHTDQFTQAPFILRHLKTKSVYFCLEPLKIGYEYSLRIPDDFPTMNKIYEAINRLIRKKIDIKNARSADFTLSISKFGRELMIQAFDLYPKVSYLGLNTKLFRNLNIKKRNQVLFIGQKIKMNGYDYAVAAMNYIPKNIRPKLKVVSISREKSKRLTDAEIVKLYNESLVTLCLSNFDTFGLVTLESLACGVPVIAFDVAGYRETMISGKTGHLVGFDAREIASKITELIEDPELRNKMGHYGRKWADNKWTWEVQIKKLESLLISEI